MPQGLSLGMVSGSGAAEIAASSQAFRGFRHSRAHVGRERGLKGSSDRIQGDEVRHLRSTILSAIAVGTSLAPATRSVLAQERLIMPYACDYDGSRIIVKPSPGTAYDILGRREQQPFTSCTASEDRCTTLMVHRFDISCGGVRVPWMRVAAAVVSSDTGQRQGRRGIENGRLAILRPARDGDRGAKPCAETSARDGDRGSRDCLPWRPSTAMERYLLPAGFAPLGEASARLEAGTASPANSPADTAVAGPPDAIAKVIAATEPPPNGAVAAQPAAETAAEPAAEPVAEPAVRPVPPRPPAPIITPGRGAAGKKSNWVTVIEAKDLSDATQHSAAGGLGLALAWLGGLGMLGALAWGLSPGRRDTVLSHASAVLSVSKLAFGHVMAAALARLSKSAGRAPAENNPDGEYQPNDSALASAAWSAATLLDQIEQAVKGLEAGTPLRDVLEQELGLIHQRLVSTRAAALDGGGAASAKAASQFRALIRELERVRRIANSAAASQTGVRPVYTVPQSKSEAYALLGVNSDVSDGILKKLVDALRMTWHPDHARSEEDRLLREDRIKQINIAWDLISDKQQVA